MRSTWFGLAATILPSMTSRDVHVQSCPIESATVTAAVRFLEAARSDSSIPADCAVGALHKLHKADSRAAIDVLAKYPDYKRPPDIVATGSNVEAYPAVCELFTIGRPALPALVRILVRTDSSKGARDHSLRAAMMIHRGDPPAGIRFLSKEAAKSNDGGDAQCCGRQHTTECGGAATEIGASARQF